MTLISNENNEIRNEENQLIILKNEYCTTIIADKNKPVTSFSYHLKEA